MIIYHDVVSGDELFSDAFPMHLIDDLYYEVDGKTSAVGSNDIDDSLIGGNQSAEVAQVDQEFNPDVQYECNIITSSGLKATSAMTNKDYVKGTLKPYIKKIHQKLVADGKEERAAKFKADFPTLAAKLKAMWDDLLPYTGKSMDPDAMVCFMNYRDNGDPYMIFFKDGLWEEKV